MSFWRKIAGLAVRRVDEAECDTCPPGLTASIIYISPRAEFTPPVIYSQSARTKLVFLVEARPDAPSADTPSTTLPPGLPVSVAPLAK